MMNSQNETPEDKLSENPKKCRRRFWRAPFMLGFILVKAAVVMVLWNNLVPDLFHGPTLVYVQALGLMILAKLMDGFGRPGFGRFGHHGHHGGRGEFWAKMSHEERHKLREQLRQKWKKD